MRQKNFFFIIIYFCFFLSLVFFAVFAIKNIAFNKTPKATQGNTNTKSITSTVESKAEKTLTITASEINLLVTNYGAEYIESPNTTITKDGVVVTGNVKKFFGSKASATIIPEINNDNLELKITELKAGVINPPKWTYSQLTKIINAKLQTTLTKNMVVKSIELTDNKIILRGK